MFLVQKYDNTHLIFQNYSLTYFYSYGDKNSMFLSIPLEIG